MSKDLIGEPHLLGGSISRGASGDFVADDCREPIRALIEALDGAGVRYCHWKSNIRLPQSLRGDEDLDLLVHREDARSFSAALVRAGFKSAVSRGGLTHPGVFHAFALNETGSGLVHVHGYFGVVSGDSLVKSYRLPVERDLLAPGHEIGVMPVPPAEAELALFALRILLKHVHPVELAMVRRGYSGVVREMNWLRRRADLERASELWRAWMPGDRPPSLDEAIDAISTPDAWFRRFLLGRRLAAALRDRRRIGTLRGERERWRRVGALAVDRIRRRRDLVPQSGGLIVAMVGPKAVGKSTLGGELLRRLGHDLDVRYVHVGKPPATPLSLPTRLLLPLARRLFRKERSGEYEKPERRSGAGYSLLHVLRMTLVAHDRAALLRRCWKDAAGGAIIVTDRYPPETPGAMDGSVFDDAAIAACRTPLKRWLMRREQAFYAGLPRPDLVIRLSVSPETAVRRDATRIKADAPDAEAVLRRWKRESSGSFGPVPVVEVSTDRTIDESAAQVTRAVWAAI